MEFDFKGWNAKVDEAQSFRPGTPEFTRRIKDQLERDKRPIDLYGWDKDEEKENKSGCFVSTACIEAMGLDGNCSELSILKRFRDDFVGNAPGGKGDIREYYELAPAIVDSINSKGESQQIYDVIYRKMILPVIYLIENGKPTDAYALCRAFLQNLRQTFG
jgi:hypothetical protein